MRDLGTQADEPQDRKQEASVVTSGGTANR